MQRVLNLKRFHRFENKVFVAKKIENNKSVVTIETRIRNTNVFVNCGHQFLSENEVSTSAENGKMCKKCKTNQIYKQRCNERLNEIVKNVDKTLIKSKSKPCISIELPKSSYENAVPLGNGSYGEVRKISIDFARKTFFKSPDDISNTVDDGTFLNFASEVAITKYLQDDRLFKVNIIDTNVPHANILECYGAFMSPNGPYSYLMKEFTFDLKAAIDLFNNNRYAELYVQECIQNIYNDCKRGLQHMHFMSVTHNDFKENNILITVNDDQSMRATISDLGNATFYGAKAVKTLAYDDIYMFQTNAYKSPELLVFLIDDEIANEKVRITKNHTIDELDAKKMDLWAFAVTMIKLANLKTHIFDENALYKYNNRKNKFEWNSYSELMKEINKYSNNPILGKTRNSPVINFEAIAQEIFGENENMFLQVIFDKKKTIFINENIENELQNLSLFNYRKRNWNDNVYWNDNEKKDTTLFNMNIVLNKKSNAKLESTFQFNLVFPIKKNNVLKKLFIMNDHSEQVRLFEFSILLESREIVKSFISTELATDENGLKDYAGFEESVLIHAERLFYHYLNHFSNFSK